MIRLLTRTILIAALLAPTALPAQQGAAGTGAHAPVGKTKVLTRQEFDQTLADNPDVILLDLRRPDEITSIGGFPIYLSIQFTDVNKYWERIPKGAKIITVSNHAARAVRAADLLDEKGVKVLGAIGAQTYEQEGGTIVHIKAPEPKAPGSGAAK